MYIKKTILDSVFVIESKPICDDRGFFQRTFEKKFIHKINNKINFCDYNSSYSEKKGTIRGMHAQIKPFSECKIFKVINGKTFHVVVDIRSNSKFYLKWKSVIISDKNNLQLYVPKGFLHGCQSMENNTIIAYNSTSIHSPDHELVISYKDPDLKIKWPIKKTIISKKDKNANNISNLKENLF